jgi:DNA invertase Pin-like site-specific DNA recombinase
MAAVSQWEREAIGERTRDALRHKPTSGERVGNIRFGFRLSPDGKHVEPDPGEQACSRKSVTYARAATHCEGSRPR